MDTVILQFKDMRWPLHPSWAEIVLIGTLMLLYWMTLMQLGLRFRLELYDALLKKSLAGPG